ncbi:MAG: signal recognition particle protein, partial [Actinobacteria bacterium]|nr:signal recognition particle protein [Actinomycetota bacterium]
AAVTGRPVFFVGTGEKPADLEPFHPDRMASRILGMGDVLSLIEKAEQTVDAEKAAEAAERMLKARFTLEDFLVQMREMKKLGPIQDLLAMLPGVPGGKSALKDLAGQVDDRQLAKTEAIILSMTPEERRNPAIIGGGRRLRIARGSGTTTADVNGLLKEFEQARKMMRQMMGGKRMPRFPGMPKMPGTS